MERLWQRVRAARPVLTPEEKRDLWDEIERRLTEAALCTSSRAGRYKRRLSAGAAGRWAAGAIALTAVILAARYTLVHAPVASRAMVQAGAAGSTASAAQTLAAAAARQSGAAVNEGTALSTETPPADVKWVAKDPVSQSALYAIAEAVDGSSSGLWVTHDRGRTWMRVPTPAGLWVVSVHFVDVDTGFIYGTIGGQVRMYRTHDGGAHWRSVQLPDVVPRMVRTWGIPDGMQVASPHGTASWWAFSWTNTTLPRYVVLHSPDGGITWSSVDVEDGADTKSTLTAFGATDDRHGWWVVAEPAKAFQPASNRVVASGQASGQPASAAVTGTSADLTGVYLLRRSADGGQTFTETELPWSSSEYDIVLLTFSDWQHGRITLVNQTTRVQTMYQTQDGGWTWKPAM